MASIIVNCFNAPTIAQESSLIISKAFKKWNKTSFKNTTISPCTLPEITKSINSVIKSRDEFYLVIVNGSLNDQGNDQGNLQLSQTTSVSLGDLLLAINEREIDNLFVVCNLIANQQPQSILLNEKCQKLNFLINFIPSDQLTLIHDFSYLFIRARCQLYLMKSIINRIWMKSICSVLHDNLVHLGNIINVEYHLGKAVSFLNKGHSFDCNIGRCRKCFFVPELSAVEKKYNLEQTFTGRYCNTQQSFQFNQNTFQSEYLSKISFTQKQVAKSQEPNPADEKPIVDSMDKYPIHKLIGNSTKVFIRVKSHPLFDNLIQKIKNLFKPENGFSIVETSEQSDAEIQFDCALRRFTFVWKKQLSFKMNLPFVEIPKLSINFSIDPQFNQKEQHPEEFAKLESVKSLLFDQIQSDKFCFVPKDTVVSYNNHLKWDMANKKMKWFDKYFKLIHEISFKDLSDFDQMLHLMNESIPLIPSWSNVHEEFYINVKKFLTSQFIYSKFSEISKNLSCERSLETFLETEKSKIILGQNMKSVYSLGKCNENLRFVSPDKFISILAFCPNGNIDVVKNGQYSEIQMNDTKTKPKICNKPHLNPFVDYFAFVVIFSKTRITPLLEKLSQHDYQSTGEVEKGDTHQTQFDKIESEIIDINFLLQ